MNRNGEDTEKEEGEDISQEAKIGWTLCCALCRREMKLPGLSAQDSQSVSNPASCFVPSPSSFVLFLIYVNKEKAQTILLNRSQGAEIEIPSGLIHKITDNGSPVKLNIENATESRQFKQWFRKSVVTKDGKPSGDPLVVYHGTPLRFTVFSGDHPLGVLRPFPDGRYFL